MATRTARTAWTGTLQDGSGRTELASSGLGTFDVSWPKRTSDAADGSTSPEELIAAAHAACFSMAFSNVLAKAGNAPESLATSATVTFVPGTGITKSELDVTGVVAGIDEAAFRAAAEDAKANCPVSKALAGNVELTVTARLKS
jgi:lipoyl-dependent peroxiredoxin